MSENSAASATAVFRQARFLLSCARLEQLPAPDMPDIAFAGRSNAGKSSALNRITDQQSLARVSKTPGRTQLLNFFTTSRAYLVDLPGYGYAKVPMEMKAHWQKFLDGYFRQRQALRGLVVVMDIRHPLKDYDRQMLDYAVARGLPAHVLLTKADKLGRGQQAQAVQAVRRELAAAGAGGVGVQAFSSQTRQGVDEACAVVAGWLELA